MPSQFHRATFELDHNPPYGAGLPSAVSSSIAAATERATTVSRFMS